MPARDASGRFIKGSGTVTDRDRGAKALLRRLAEKHELTVGIHEADGAAVKESPDGSESTTLIDVGIIHEYGAPEAGIPERSFIRAWADESRERHVAESREVGKLVVEGKLDAETALKRLGLRRQAEVQKRISEGIDPPLSEETIARKGSSKPLINTGQLRSAITNEVKKTR